MLRIRQKPLSAKASRSPASRTEENNWNNNLTILPPSYDAKNDKHCLRFFQIRKPNRPRIKHLNSFRSHGSSSKGRKLTPTSKQEMTVDQLENLKEELDFSYKTFKIPEQHQALFRSSLQNLNKMQAAVKVAREIDSIEKGGSTVSSVLNCIEVREEKLQDLKEKTLIEKCGFEGYSRIIEDLRETSFKVIDFIEIWRNEMNCLDHFLWKGVSYYEKMRSDTDFLIETDLARYFSLFKADPLFLSTTQAVRKGKRLTSAPYNSKLITRIKKFQEVLGFFPVKLENFRSVISEVPSNLTEPINSASTIPKPEPKIDPEHQKGQKIILKDLSDQFLYQAVQLSLFEIATESCQEILLACLSLHSSSILDKIITEVLNEMIPSIARNSHTEVTDSEYLDIRNAILFEVFEEEIKRLTNQLSTSLLSQKVNDEIFTHLDFEDLIIEAIDEEKKENTKIVFIVADKILEEFFERDWAEEIAEVELINAKMEEAWIGLPVHIQREIYFNQKKRIVERIAELVYFGILNEFVGKLWLDGLVRGFLEEFRGGEEMSDEAVFVLRDPDVDDTKKAKRR